MTAPGTEPAGNSLVRLGNFVFRFRNVLFPAVLLALFLTFRPHYPGGSEHLDYLLDAVGLAVAACGQLLRVLVIGSVYIIRGGRNRRVYAKDLVTDGFFAHSRNPLYLGNLMVLLGLFVVYHNPWVYTLGAGFFILSYAAIVAAEEAYLREKFGSGYDAYMQAVPRWLPRFRGLRQSLSGIQFNWRRVVLKEYTSTYTWMAIAVVLLATETLAHHAYQERTKYLNLLWVCLALLTVGWGVARYLKKSRRLRVPPFAAT